MSILLKACKPDNYESHNSLKLSFTNIQGLRLNFVDCESFLKSNSPDILALCETNLGKSIDSGNSSVRDYLPLIQKDCSTPVHVLAVYVKEGLLFARDLSLKIVTYIYDWLYFALCLNLCLALSLCIVFYSVSSNIDQVLLINPSANVFVFGDFNVHHKD